MTQTAEHTTRERLIEQIRKAGFELGAFGERTRTLAYIRKVAQEGTADDEVKLTRLADAIERGEHE